jgi:hypothetical protein
MFKYFLTTPFRNHLNLYFSFNSGNYRTGLSTNIIFLDIIHRLVFIYKPSC